MVLVFRGPGGRSVALSLLSELKCPFFNTNAYLIVEYKSNILGCLVSLILLFALGWLSF